MKEAQSVEIGELRSSLGLAEGRVSELVKEMGEREEREWERGREWERERERWEEERD